jgi:hypothetical protein
VRPGHRLWAIPGGHIPLGVTGDEPGATSRDEICVLNMNVRAAALKIQVYHADRDPVGPYRLEVEGKRVLHVRVNDLIDPQAVPLESPYALVIAAERPVVVMFLRKDTSQAANAILGAMAFPLD